MMLPLPEMLRQGSAEPPKIATLAPVPSTVSLLLLNVGRGDPSTMFVGTVATGKVPGLNVIVSAPAFAAAFVTAPRSEQSLGAPVQAVRFASEFVSTTLAEPRAGRTFTAR